MSSVAMTMPFKVFGEWDGSWSLVAAFAAEDKAITRAKAMESFRRAQVKYMPEDKVIYETVANRNDS